METRFYKLTPQGQLLVGPSDVGQMLVLFQELTTLELCRKALLKTLEMKDVSRGVKRQHSRILQQLPQMLQYFLHCQVIEEVGK